MALDEPEENDEVFEIDGCYYIIDRRLMDAVRSISIDLTPVGFIIESEKEPPDRTASVGCAFG